MKNLPSSDGWDSQQPLLDALEQTFSFGTNGPLPRSIRYVVLSIIGIREINDLAPNVFQISDFLPSTEWKRTTAVLAAYLNARRVHDSPILPAHFGHRRTKTVGSRQDPDFGWVPTLDHGIVEWKRYATDYVAQKRGYFSTEVWCINRFFDWLLETKEQCLRPEEWLAQPRHSSLSSLLYPTLEKRTQVVMNNAMHRFFGFVIEKLGEERRQDCENSSVLELRNPLDWMTDRFSYKVETHRERMPTRLVDEALTILTERTVRNDSGDPIFGPDGEAVEEEFAWAKSFGRRRAGVGDWFYTFDPVTLERRHNWSPVRACVLILKLMLPARTFQIRYQESDEQDTEIYRNGRWVQNHHPLAVSPSSRGRSWQRGALRKYVREDGSQGAHIYFNTNKSEYVDVSPERRGYTMPWEHLDAISVYQYLLEWQRTQNPVSVPTRWDTITELQAKRQGALLRNLPPATFLFRDPSSGTGEPVRDTAVRSLWGRLLGELERRIEARGETYADGSPIRLVLTWSRSGTPSRLKYDLHSLRVTRITLLYEAGVPRDLVQRIVGHRHPVMTAYYIKFGPNQVNEFLERATAAADLRKQQDWLEFVSSGTESILERSLVANDDALYSAKGKALKGSVAYLPDGICTVNKSRCSVGLVSVSEDTQKRTLSPVPGFQKNCHRCRYFITGVPFLEGLLWRTNQTLYSLREVSKLYEAAQDDWERARVASLESADFRRHESAQDSRVIAFLESKYDRLQKEVEEESRNFLCAYNLLKKVEKLTASVSPADSRLTLVTNSAMEELKVELNDVPELRQLNYLCSRAEVYELPEIDWSTTNLRRMRLIDRVLRKNGVSDAILQGVTEAQALVVGNQIAKILFAKMSNDELSDVCEGRVALSDLGLMKEVADVLGELRRLEGAQNYLPLGLEVPEEVVNDKRTS